MAMKTGGPEIDATVRSPMTGVAPPMRPGGQVPWRRTPQGQSRLLGIAMFSPAIVYLALLIGVPFVLAFVYAFTAARVGSVSFHFVGLENFRSILESPSFRKALGNSFIFTIASQILVIIGSTILSLALKDKFRGRAFIRFVILCCPSSA